MRSSLAAGLLLPAVIAAQAQSPEAPLATVIDSVFHRLGDGETITSSVQTISMSGPPVQTMTATVSIGRGATTITSWTTITGGASATTVTSLPSLPVGDELASTETILPTKGLIPIPLVSQISSTAFATGVPGAAPASSTPNGIVVVPASRVTTVTTSILLTQLGQTVTLPPQPMHFESDRRLDNTNWRLNDTAPCKEGAKFEGDKMKCRLQRCLWEHTKPLNITRAWPVVEFPITWTNATSASGNRSSAIGFTLGKVDDYRTFWAQEFVALSHVPHWGTTKEGLYYPYRTLVSSVMAPPTTIMNKKATTIIPETGVWQSTIERVAPTALAQQYEPAPSCSSFDECYAQCAAVQDKQAKHRRGTRGAIIGSLIGGPLLLSTLCCCLCCCRRRHKHPRETPGTDIATTTTQSGAEPATGGQVVSTAEKQGGDTAGRQAEEGRSRVHFPEQGSETVPATTTTAGQAVPPSGQTTEKVADGPGTAGQKVANAPAEGAQHVESVPAHDGADSWPTGSHRFAMDSMRGRRKMRADLRNLF